MAAAWNSTSLPDLAGRTAIVTGANGGLGLEAARVLAGKGARVILACRDRVKGERAETALRDELPDATLECRELDLASLDSVRRFAEAFAADHPRLDILLNNAGVMAIPERRTADGFEMQLGTNHLGHFALTGLLLEPLLRSPGARVVSVSSTAHRIGRIRFEDLQWRSGYRKWPAYGQSKLANLLFTFALQRRLEAAGARAAALAAHPGYAATNLQTTGPKMAGSRFGEGLMNWANRSFAQSARRGALPLLYAAAAPEAEPGGYYGPGGMLETRGAPVRVAASRRAREREDQERFWQLSEELTRVSYGALERAQG